MNVGVVQPAALPITNQPYSHQGQTGDAVIASNN